MPLAKKAATLSFCHGSRSLRMTMAILVANLIAGSLKDQPSTLE